MQQRHRCDALQDWQVLFAALVESIEEWLAQSRIFGDGRDRSPDLFRIHALRLVLLLRWNVSRNFLAEHIRAVGQNLGLDIAPRKADAYAAQLELIYKDRASRGNPNA